MPIIDLPGDHKMLVVAGDQLSNTEIRAVRDHNLTVQVEELPLGDRDLRVLSPVSDAITSLGISARGASDLSEISRMRRLSSLSIDPEFDSSRDLTACENLTSYIGWYGPGVVLPRSATFKYLELYGSDFGSIGEARFKVRQMRLSAHGRGVELTLDSPTYWAPAIEQMYVRDFQKVTIGNLTSLVHLSELTICGVKHVVNAEGLKGLRGTSVDVRSKCPTTW